MACLPTALRALTISESSPRPTLSTRSARSGRLGLSKHAQRYKPPSAVRQNGIEGSVPTGTFPIPQKPFPAPRSHPNYQVKEGFLPAPERRDRRDSREKTLLNRLRWTLSRHRRGRVAVRRPGIVDPGLVGAVFAPYGRDELSG